MKNIKVWTIYTYRESHSYYAVGKFLIRGMNLWKNIKFVWTIYIEQATYAVAYLGYSIMWLANIITNFLETWYKFGNGNGKRAIHLELVKN